MIDCYMSNLTQLYGCYNIDHNVECNVNQK